MTSQSAQTIYNLISPTLTEPLTTSSIITLVTQIIPVVESEIVDTDANKQLITIAVLNLIVQNSKLSQTDKTSIMALISLIAPTLITTMLDVYDNKIQLRLSKRQLDSSCLPMCTPKCS